MNKSDSERIAGYLEKHGYGLAKSSAEADLVVLTTCGVRQSAEDRVYGLINKIKKDNPKVTVVLTGCLSNRQDVRHRLKNEVDVWLHISELPDLDAKIKSLGLKIKAKDKKNCDFLKIRPKHSSKFSAFVPIGNGCDNFCSYCVVPYARGREAYRPAEEILAEVKSLVKNGYREIILIAQNVNSYNSKVMDKSQTVKSKMINFSNLLKMVNDLSGNFWVRFATSHPKDMSNELIRTISKCKKICVHIHLPAQAGDNVILKKMNRKYTRQDYIQLARKIRKVIKCHKMTKFKGQIKSKIPNLKFLYSNLPVSITTDIIVGFPGETKKQFANTVKLFKEVKFDMAYIARYSPRPGTAAYQLQDDVPLAEKKRREKELLQILRKTALANNKKYLSETVAVLVAGQIKKGEFFGYTRTNKNVKLGIKNKKPEVRIGDFVRVKITKAKDFGLEGEII